MQAINSSVRIIASAQVEGELKEYDVTVILTNNQARNAQLFSHVALREIDVELPKWLASVGVPVHA